MTIRQQQCLLAYLGYYTGEMDGLWGWLSREATERFQTAYGLETDGIFGPNTERKIREVIASGETPTESQDTPSTPQSGKTGTFWDEIRYFTREEFRCKCGGKYCSGFPAEPQETLLRAADQVREHFGNPMPVSSGVRCPTHNANVGGVSNSRHLSGKAMDFRVSGFSAAMVLSYVQQLKTIRYAYAIDGSFVHMDIE